MPPKRSSKKSSSKRMSKRKVKRGSKKASKTKAPSKQVAFASLSPAMKAAYNAKLVNGNFMGYDLRQKKMAPIDQQKFHVSKMKNGKTLFRISGVSPSGTKMSAIVGQF